MKSKLFAFLLGVVPINALAISDLISDSVDTAAQVTVINNNIRELSSGKLDKKPSDIIPKRDSTYSLGSTDYRWYTLYSDTANVTNITANNITVTTVTATNVVATTETVTYLYTSAGVGVETTNVESSLVVAGNAATSPSVTGIHMGKTGTYGSIQIYSPDGGYLDISTTTGQDYMWRYIVYGGDLQIGSNSIIPIMQFYRTTGNVWVVANFSALSFTDRTPYPRNKQEAYDAVNSMKLKANGEGVDHESLSSFIRVERSSGTVKTYERDLSATASALNEVVKDLIKRIEVLEKK